MKQIIADSSLKSRPHDWQENVEIDFQDGSFGYRATGMATTTATAGHTVIMIQSPSQRFALVSTGGNFVTNNTGAAAAAGERNVQGDTGSHFHFVVNGSGHTLQCYNYFGAIRTNQPYDIHAIYTKI